MKEQNSKVVISELMHLDAPLVIAELTNYGESIKNIPWAKEVFLYHPYCVFERKNNVLYFIYDQNGINWKIEQAGNFDEKILIHKVLESFAEVDTIIKEEKALKKHEFTNFIKKVKDFWVWFDGIWWAIEYREKNKEDFSELMKVRKHTEYFIPGLIATIRNTFKELVPDHKKYIDVLSLDEVLENKIPTAEVLEKRVETYAYTDGNLFENINEVEKKYNIYVRRDNFLKDEELKGQVAYSGKVKGTVKIVKNRDDMKNFKEGNIIVSPTTTPDFLPVMKIASAIISEHGGIICHAAITSRELKIPCIVGVKGATQVLKDGDMVEVDAENGIVKIIK